MPVSVFRNNGNLKAKVEIDKPLENGKKIEVSKKIDPIKAKQIIKSDGAKSPRSVFSKGMGKRPNAMRKNAMINNRSNDNGETQISIPKSAFSNLKG